VCVREREIEREIERKGERERERERGESLRVANLSYPSGPVWRVVAQCAHCSIWFACRAHAARSYTRTDSVPPVLDAVVALCAHCSRELVQVELAIFVRVHRLHNLPGLGAFLSPSLQLLLLHFERDQRLLHLLHVQLARGVMIQHFKGLCKTVLQLCAQRPLLRPGGQRTLRRDPLHNDHDVFEAAVTLEGPRGVVVILGEQAV
jgi:hypothetical protein